MFFKLLWLNFLLIPMLGSVSVAKIRSCNFLFGPSPSGLVRQKLSKFPELATYVSEMAKEKSTSIETKKMLEWFASRNDIEIKTSREFTEETGQEFTEYALKRTHFSNIKFKAKEDYEYLPYHLDIRPLAKKIKKRKNKTYSVIYLREDIGSIKEQFAYLVHELAHVRFDTFFDQNAIRYVGLLPQNVITVHEGRVVVSLEVFSYLTERYAYQKEFEITQGILGENYLGIHGESGLYRDIVNEIAVDALRPTTPNIDQFVSRFFEKSIHNIFIKYHRPFAVN